LRALALAAALGLLPLSPWWAYNGVTLGNPFAPFLSSLFPSPYWTPADAAIYAAHAAEKGGLARGWTTDLAVLPYRAATAPMRDHPSVAAHPERWLGDWPVGPLALAGLPLLVLLILPGAPRRMRWAALLWLWLYLAWAASYRDLRFLLPFLAVQAALLGALLEWGAGDRRAARALTLPMLAGQTAMALLLALRVTAAPTPAGRAPLGYVLGFTSRQQFLADKIPDNFTPALDWLRRHPRPGERTLIVGLNHGYYLPRECILGDFFSTSPLLAWAREAGSVSGLEARLSREGVTRVVFVGENLCHPAYQYWFFLHALPEETARQALRNRTSGTYGTDSEAYRILAAWKTASRRWVRVYPEGGPELENGPGPWGLPPTTLIYSTQPDSSAEPIDNTSLRRQSPG
ncbi:hypothetical protein HS125_21205, partial [bacterium]|nr:hypothetical protein [bacterium]